MAAAHNHRLVWERAIRLAGKVHTATRPEASTHGLIDQMRRCSIAVASQLAHAYSLANRSERIRLLGIARAALFELDTQIRVAIDLQAVDPGHGIETDIGALEIMVTASIQELREQPDRYSPRGVTVNSSSRLSSA